MACGLGVLLALLTALIGHLCGSSAVAGCGVLAAIAIGVFYAYWRIIVSLAVLLLVLYLVAG